MKLRLLLVAVVAFLIASAPVSAPGGERDLSQKFDPGQHVAIQQLEDAARIYTLAAIELCSLSRAEAQT